MFSNRKLSALVLEKASSNNSRTAQATTREGSTEVNLTGDREFLTTESATEALALLLAPDTAVTKVPPSLWLLLEHTH